jgi:histidinol-phosphate/aromatic aminotransferase/cobyric acid decarboxylase-like protein
MDGYKTHGSKSNTILIALETKNKADYITTKLQESGILVRGKLPNPVESWILVTMGSRQLVENFYHQFTTLLNSYK